MTRMRQMSLTRGKERYVYRYPLGREGDLIDVFAEQASDSRLSFDWFDAAVLSYKLGQRLEKELGSIVEGN